VTTNLPHETFIYLSDWMNRPVYDSEHKRIGKMVDAIADTTTHFPPLRALIIRKQGTKYRYQPTSAELMTWLSEERVTIDPAKLSSFQTGKEEFLVRDWLWDRQIVDISGAKVKRVNDVQLLIGRESHIVHVDVGFLGLVRRLGFEPGVKFLAKLAGKKLEEELISWKYVAPVKGQGGAPLQLSIQINSLRNLHPAELADVLEDLDKEERAEIVRAVGPETAAAALEVSEEEVQKSVLESLSAEESADILEEMELQVAADVLEVVGVDVAEAMLAEVDPETREDITELAAHKDETAGSLMSSDFMSCHPDDTAEDVLEQVRRLAREIEAFLYIYVIDSDDKCLGVVSLRAVLTASPLTPITELMHKRFLSVEPETEIKEVAELFATYDFAFCPVLKDEKMLGIISLKHSFDDLLPLFWKRRND